MSLFVPYTLNSLRSSVVNLVKQQSQYATKSLQPNVKTIIQSDQVFDAKYKIKVSPLFSQICDLYKQYPGYIVLINVGSFYELYFEQAYNYSKLLNINLVNKKIAGNKYNIPFSGFPTYQLSKFLNLIVKENNMKAVIVDQIGDQLLQKNKIIERKVTRIVTPGTYVEDAFKEVKENVFTAALYFNSEDTKIGISWTDLSTGELYTMECDKNQLEYQLQRINPKEVVVLTTTSDEDKSDFFIKSIVEQENGSNYFVSKINRNGTYNSTSIKAFTFIFSLKERKQFEIIVSNLDINQTNALKILLYYLHTQFPNMLSDPESNNINLNLPISISNSKILKLDSLTIKSLELYETMARNSHVGTLFNHLNKNITNNSSSRLLKGWISQPLTDYDKINERYDIIEFLQNNGKLKVKLINFLKDMKDITKILQQIAMKNVGGNTGFQVDLGSGQSNIKNLYNLCSCLNAINSMKEYLIKSIPNSSSNAAFLKLVEQLKYDDIDSIKNVLAFIDPDVIMDESDSEYDANGIDIGVVQGLEGSEKEHPLFTEKVYFKTGFDSCLDDLVSDYQQILLDFFKLKTQLEERFTKNLKMKSIEFKNTISKGFHIEVNSGTAKAWKTLLEDPVKSKFKEEYPILSRASNKKFKNINLIFCQQWAEIGEKLLDATSRIKQRNNQLIKQIQHEMIRDSSLQIRLISAAINKLDILIAFTEFSNLHDLTRPKLTKDQSENLYLPEMKNFQLLTCKPNTTLLLPNKFQIITGSNKSGKSNYLKSICYSIILAQIGCFVPTAEGAVIPILNHLSYKSQAMDDINQGVSGFAFETLQIVDVFRELQPKLNSKSSKEENEWKGGTLLLFDEFNKCTHWKESLGLTYTYLKQLYLWNQHASLKNHRINVISSLHLGGELVQYLEEVDPGFLKEGLEFWKFEIVKNNNYFDINSTPSSELEDSNAATDHLKDYKSYKYDYTLKPGVSTKSDALKVCHEFGYPTEVLSLAEKSIQNVWRVFK